MKKTFIALAFILMLAAGCSKYNEKHLPVNATYVLKGDSATFYVNGIDEWHGTNQLVIVSGRTVYTWSPAYDTLFKDVWTGDKLSVSAKSYTSVYYKSGSGQGYLADSSASKQASITVQQ